MVKLAREDEVFIDEKDERGYICTVFLPYPDAHTWQKINVSRCVLEKEESGKMLFNLCGYYYFGSFMVS